LDLQKVFNSVWVAARQKVLFVIWHPRWALDAFWDFEIPQDLVVGYGYPQLTEQAKRKILGENLLRLSGMDVDDTRRKLSGAA
jgi:uncharacterized protein